MADKVYSVWYKPHNRWTNNHYKGQKQDTTKPFRLSLQEATDFLQECSLVSDFEIREVLPDNTSAPVRVYNVWFIPGSRWTNHNQQKTDEPQHLTLEEATRWQIVLQTGLHKIEFEVREVLADNTSAPVVAATPQPSATPAANPCSEVKIAEPTFNFDAYNSLKSLPKTHW